MSFEATWVAPAVVFAIVSYLVLFFGKAIADQKPFCDDRKWDIEILGVMFLANTLLPFGAVGAAIAYSTSKTEPSNFLNIIFFLTLQLFQFGYAVATSQLSEKIYFKKDFYSKVVLPMLSALPKSEQKEKKLSDRKHPLIVAFVKGMATPVTVAFVGYVLTRTLLFNNLVWLVFILTQSFLLLALIAFYSSLKKVKEMPKIRIHLKSDGLILEGMLLKYNPDNIRVRLNEEASIVNLSDVSRVDVLLDKDSIIPLNKDRDNKAPGDLSSPGASNG